MEPLAFVNISPSHEWAIIAVIVIAVVLMCKAWRDAGDTAGASSPAKQPTSAPDDGAGDGPLTLILGIGACVVAFLIISHVFADGPFDYVFGGVIESGPP